MFGFRRAAAYLSSTEIHPVARPRAQASQGGTRDGGSGNIVWKQLAELLQRTDHEEECAANEAPRT
jgi:hypothetical protein